MMKTKDLIVELSTFHRDLKAHNDLYRSSTDIRGHSSNREELETQQERLVRQFGKLEPYIRKYSHLVIGDPTTGTREDPWINALADERFPVRKPLALRGIIMEVNRIIGLLETVDKEEILLEDMQVLFDSLKLHADIVRVSKKAFDNGLYPEAILNAFKEVIIKVRDVSGLKGLDGKPLMDQAFALGNPKIKLNNLETQSEKDEQAGFMQIYGGVAVGIRNPKAHDNIEQKDPYKTIEYLCIASLLMKRIDERVK